jgi:hypothetical protein
MAAYLWGVPSGSQITAAEADAWATGAMPQAQLGEKVEAIPNTNCSPGQTTYQSYTNSNGQFSSIPRDLTISTCIVSNQLGTFASTGDGSGYNFVLPSTTYGYRIIDAIGRTTSIVPFPNQAGFLYSAESNNIGGKSVRLHDSVRGHGVFGPVYGQTNELAYTLNSPAPQLKDDAGNTIYYYHHAFSSNGEWLLIEAQYLGYIRINTKTKQMQLISKNYMQYGQGYLINQSLAISDDGMSAIVGYTDGSILAFDLGGCQQTPILHSYYGGNVEGCIHRDIKPVVTAQVSGLRSLAKLSFSPNGKSVNGYAVRNGALNVTERYAITIAVAGYQEPKLGYLALGDSFSSGEGAYDYELGTDVYDLKKPLNVCHLSKKSYPHLTAEALGISDFRSVACSGAKYDPHYSTDPQYSQAAAGLEGVSYLPGIKTQQEFIRLNNPNILTISMMGNDIGFGNKIRRCIMQSDSCFHFREEREAIAQEINSKFDTLVSMYADMKNQSKNAKVYVLGYPNLLNPEGECGINSPVDQEERLLAKGMVSYLNTTILAATEKAGVSYINVENAFEGKMLCDISPNKAVNGITSGDDQPSFLRGPLGNESFHPNQLGHQLFSQSLLAQSQNLTKPNPQPNLTKSPPSSTSTVYSQLIGGATYGSTFKKLTYTELEGLETIVKAKQTPIEITEKLLKSSSLYQIWVNSEPTFVGNLSTDINGKLTGEISIPTSVPPGYHTLHIIGQDISGENIDLYKTIYVAETEDDIDGDGTPNVQEKCLAIAPSNIDVDRDGRDDACDAEIGLPPADTTPPIVQGNTSAQSINGWYNSDIVVSWSATDPEPSSGAPTQPTSTTITTVGETTTKSDPSCDPLGNCATGSFTAKIDKTAPSLGAPDWSNNPKTTSSTSKITIGVLDGLSGVDQTEYFIGDTDPGEGNGATMRTEGSAASVDFGIDFQPGVYKISFRAQDRAGNWSDPVSDHLIVYGPSDLRLSGRRAVIPSIDGGDTLPGLISNTQTNKFRFGMHVRFNKAKQLQPGSDFHASYRTGNKCDDPTKAYNCHTFYLDSHHIGWIIFSGDNDNTAQFAGKADLYIDGQRSTAAYRVIAKDAKRSSGLSADHYEMLVYAEDSDIFVGQPTYRVSRELAKGDIVIKTR